MGYRGSGVVSAEGDKITHCIKGGVDKVRHQGLFLCDPDGNSGGKKVRYWLGEHFIAWFDVAYREHEWWHLIGNLCKGQELRDAHSDARGRCCRTKNSRSV